MSWSKDDPREVLPAGRSYDIVVRWGRSLTVRGWVSLAVLDPDRSLYVCLTNELMLPSEPWPDWLWILAPEEG